MKWKIPAGWFIWRGQGAGVYSVVWDGRDVQGREVTSGVYLYRLVAGEHMVVRKMILAK